MATDPFNNVDKAVYPEIPSELPPVGDMMSPDMEMEDEMMGEDDDFDIIEDEDGGVTITFGGEEGKKDPANAPFGANLAEYVDDKELSSISTDLVSMIEDDDSSRQEWKATY